MTDRYYLLALCSYLPFGPARINLLRKYFKSARNVWKASKRGLVDVGLRMKIITEFDNYRKSFDIQKYLERLKKLNIEFVTIDDENYPSNLVDLDDAPTVLYIRGELKKSDVNAVAIVGSRKITSYGREVTEKLATQLAGYGVTIISGLAFGVDLAAHKEAVEVGGRCVAVLASGVDVITPQSNEWLGKKIIKSNGAIVSEYPIGIMPQKSFFPFRNRIISGLAKAVVVVEGMQRSGTIHTANHAAKQGREVFAVPGQITSPMSGAPHYLIKNGAKMVTDVKDILDELDMQLKVDKDEVEKIMPSDKDEEKIVKVLENEELHVDEIARLSKINANEVSAKLTMMELKGIIKNLGGGVYKIS
jgi:DNA processing protein